MCTRRVNLKPSSNLCVASTANDIVIISWLEFYVTNVVKHATCTHINYSGGQCNNRIPIKPYMEYFCGGLNLVKWLFFVRKKTVPSRVNWRVNNSVWVSNGEKKEGFGGKCWKNVIWFSVTTSFCYNNVITAATIFWWSKVKLSFCLS